MPTTKPMTEAPRFLALEMFVVDLIEWSVAEYGRERTPDFEFPIGILSRKTK